MIFPSLYKYDAKEKIRQWDIKVENNVIKVEHGLEDGVKTTTEEIILKGKNIGRSNETSKEEQAVLEAKSKWTKKKDSGYSESKNKNAINYKPMLANDFKKQKNLNYPVLVQPKLDGYRMIYIGPEDKIVSRTGKEFSIMYNTPLHKFLQQYKKMIFDGELYLHGGSFQDLGVIRKKKNDDLFLLDLEYHIYDIMDENKTFSERSVILNTYVKPTKNIKIVETFTANSKEDIEKFHEIFLNKNYEGTIVRQNSNYVHNRTNNLLKYKDFEDDEFKVIDFTHEKDTKGDNLLPVVWICITNDKKIFSVASKGTREERDELYKNGKNYVGKILTVQFFGKSEEGVPRFPKTLRPGKSSFRIKE